MKKELSYKGTIKACYMGYVVLAIVINLTPILFVPLKNIYGITFEQLGILILVNFVVQVVSDLVFAKPADKYGARIFVVLAQVLSIVGLLIFAFAANWFTDIFTGLFLGTILFSVGGGLLELLINPIVNAIPNKEKTVAMNILHSFYSWGQIAVILITTLLVYFWGTENWKWIVLLWIAVPFINIFLFAKVPIAPFVKKGKKQVHIKNIINSKYFILIVICIIMGAASEHVMGEWSSTFMEKAAGFSKILGDTAGVCMFAFMMGIGRIIYAKTGGKNLNTVMIAGAGLAFASYVLIACSSNGILTFMACALCGLAVSIMWPGCIVLASDRFEGKGASMFSLLAASGDAGAAFAPWLVGIVAEMTSRYAGEVIGLKTAMLVACIFPAILFITLIFVKKDQNKYLSNNKKTIV